MQNDNEKFDLLVRSMMQDAEEPVSPRVWEGVSAGLASRNRRPVFWRYAAGLAAAAAVVLGVVLFGTHDDNSNLPIHIDTLSLDAAIPDSSVPDKASDPEREPVLIPTTNLLADNRVQAKPRKDGTVPQPQVHPVRPEQTRPGGEKDVPGGDGSVSAPSGNSGLRSSGGEPGDPFALLEQEDARERKAVRVHVALGGSLQSNGNPSMPSTIQMMRAPANRKRTHTVIEQTGATSVYAVPVSAGLNVRIGTGGRWALGTGLTWTMLQRNFYGTFREKGAEPVYSEINNTLHYVGIPVNASYSLLDNGRIGLYAFAGGSVEKAVANRFRSIGSDALFHNESVDGVQFSLAAGFGVQFRLTDHVGLYIDPGLHWYIPGNQPRSIRTQQPLMMNFEIGLRFGT